MSDLEASIALTAFKQYAALTSKHQLTADGYKAAARQSFNRYINELRSSKGAKKNV